MPANAPPQPVGHAQPAQDFFKDQDREEALEPAGHGNGGHWWISMANK